MYKMDMVYVILRQHITIHSVKYLSSVEEFLGKKYGPESVCVVGSGART